jgi:hypothetical protein
MENEPRAIEEKTDRIKNENTEDSCLYMAYFLDEELAGKTIVGCEEMKDKWKEVLGRKILGIAAMQHGGLTVDKDDREYSVDMIISRKNRKHLLVTIAKAGEEIEWNETSLTLKVFGEHERTLKFALPS